MTKTITDFEIDKQQKKQLLVRNEFLYNSQSDGKYNFPIIKKQKIDINEVELLSYADAKINDEKNMDKTIHFFTYDWKFEKVYEKPEEEFEKLKQYKYLLSPDFSIFTNMPLALQIESVFKNRWCGAYWQSKGLKVIPTVSWGDENSFEFCFDGIEEGSVVAVCTYYRENCEEEFMLGYNEMMKRIKPSMIICYDEPFKSMRGNIIEFLPTTYEWTKNLSWKDQIQFKWEKQNRNVCGLNEKDFKFFKYDDPYKKIYMAKCPVCEKIALEDQFGNGKCDNCGFEYDKVIDEEEKNYGATYPLLVTRETARKQYKNGQPFKATFNEFVGGLMFYGEMEFEYLGEKYIVFRYTDKFEIEFYNDNDYKNKQIYNSKEAFENNANINGKLLKDIWQNVENAQYMS